MKKILAISQRILDVFKADFQNYEFVIEFLNLLISFREFYNTMCGKILEPGWEQNASVFLERLKHFLRPSCSIGLIYFHNIIHGIDICKKYQIGLGGLGLDQCIENLHSFVNFQILPNITNIKTPSAKRSFSESDPADTEYIEHFRDLHGRQIESSLNPQKLGKNNLDHTEYLKNVVIDRALIAKFDSEA